MPAPVVVTANGATLAPDAAASWARITKRRGRAIQCSSSYRDWNTQMKMYLAWQAYVNGTGPKPPHGRAIPPWESMHCQGLAVDSNDQAYLKTCSDYGWSQEVGLAANEPWHFEYSRARDKFYGTPTGGSMSDESIAKAVWDTTVNRGATGQIKALQELADAKTNTQSILGILAPVSRGSHLIPMRQEWADTKTNTILLLQKVETLLKQTEELLARPAPTIPPLTEEQLNDIAIAIAAKIQVPTAAEIAKATVDEEHARLKE